jgi:hypothetical protein
MGMKGVPTRWNPKNPEPPSRPALPTHAIITGESHTLCGLPVTSLLRGHGASPDVMRAELTDCKRCLRVIEARGYPHTEGTDASSGGSGVPQDGGVQAQEREGHAVDEALADPAAGSEAGGGGDQRQELPRSPERGREGEPEGSARDALCHLLDSARLAIGWVVRHAHRNSEESRVYDLPYAQHALEELEKALAILRPFYVRRLAVPEDVQALAGEFLRKHRGALCTSESYDELATLLLNVRLQEREECAETAEKVHPQGWRGHRGCASEIRNRPR